MFLFFFFGYFFTFLFLTVMLLYVLYRVCPDEVREAISSLLYAASRCGEFPELQEIRAVMTTRFGKEFAASAIELRNNCGVNRKVYYDLENFQDVKICLLGSIIK